MIGKQHKLLPFLNDIRKNRVSIGKKMETNKLKKIAKKLGIRVTTKHNGKRVYKSKRVLAKQIQKNK